MFIELTELLTCPKCGPAQGLVAVVAEMKERRVLEGYLGCPMCEARYPITGGEVDLRGSDEAAVPDEAARPADAAGLRAPDPSDPRFAVTVAALLDLAECPAGCLLVDEDLAFLATDLLRLGGAKRFEVLALASAPEGERSGVTSLRAGTRSGLPVRSRSLRGVALHGSGRSRLEEAVRVLAPGGRLVVLAPAAGLVEALEAQPVRTLVVEERALVAVRTA
ncbi:MAG: hypothetical protein ACE5HQ_10065 [Gemmatimonadota bacterium]